MLDCKTILLIVGVILIFNVMNLYNSSKSSRKAKRITKLELIKKNILEKFTDKDCKRSCDECCIRKMNKDQDCHQFIEKENPSKKDQRKYMDCVGKKATICIRNKDWKTFAPNCKKIQKKV